MFLALLLPMPCMAGAWLQEEGRILLSTQAIYYSTDRYFNAGGNLTPQQHFSKAEFNLYGEMGWRDNVTLGTNLFLNRVRQAGEENAGISDAEFFARLRLWQAGGSVLSLQPLVKLPSYYQNAGTPRGGSESFDTELSLLFGHSFSLLSTQDFIDARIGYRERSRGLNGQWRTDLSYGTQLTDSWQLIASARNVTSADLQSETFRNDGELDYDLGKAEFTAIYTIDPWRSWHATYFGHVSGRQTGSGQGVMLGLTQRF